jgi:hypothetical protein
MQVRGMQAGLPNPGSPAILMKRSFYEDLYINSSMGLTEQHDQIEKMELEV